jgi:uncharacterized membrane protein
MMKLFQMLVFTAVMFSNIHWQWTPNGYLASLISIGVTFIATVSLLWIIDVSRRAARYIKPRRGRGHQRVYQRTFPPALPRR